MAKAKFSVVLCMLLVLILVAECSSKEMSMTLMYRKFLMEKKKTEVGFNSKGVSGYEKNTMTTEDWELRGVPAGPDPLHHNGQDPNKPRTP